VRLYDSSVSCKLAPSLIRQLKQIYQVAIKNGHLIVTKMPVQQQLNGTDCGVFSIAFAYHLAVGDEPSALDFSKGMRQHLVACFEREAFHPFPHVQGNSAMHCSKKYRTICC